MIDGTSDPMDESAFQEILRRLALGDERAVSLAMLGGGTDTPLLDSRTAALVRLSCLTAMESNRASLQAAISECWAAGAERHEMLDVIDAIAPLVGTVRTTEAAAHILPALESTGSQSCVRDPRSHG